jgi:hypothetical protein
MAMVITLYDWTSEFQSNILLTLKLLVLKKDIVIYYISKVMKGTMYIKNILHKKINKFLSSIYIISLFWWYTLHITF